MVCGVYPTSGKCGRASLCHPPAPPYNASTSPQEGRWHLRQSLCVDCADDGAVGAYEVYDGAGFLLSVQPEKAGVQFL